MNISRRSVRADQLVAPHGIEVPWGEWRIGNRSDLLYTTGVEECIPVGIHDVVSGIGHMAHVLATNESQDAVIPPFSSSVLDTCEGDTSRLSICIIGGVGHDESSHLLLAAMARRSRIVELLLKEGIDGQWQTEWNDNEPAWPQMLELYCNTGAFVLTDIIPAPWRPQMEVGDLI